MRDAQDRWVEALSARSRYSRVEDRGGGVGGTHFFGGTPARVRAPQHWQIRGFQVFTIPDQIIEKKKYPKLTADAKQKIFGENVAKIFKIDIAGARKAVEGDLLYKLRHDGNALPVTVNGDKLRNP